MRIFEHFAGELGVACIILDEKHAQRRQACTPAFSSTRSTRGVTPARGSAGSWSSRASVAGSGMAVPLSESTKVFVREAHVALHLVERGQTEWAARVVLAPRQLAGDHHPQDDLRACRIRPSPRRRHGGACARARGRTAGHRGWYGPRGDVARRTRRTSIARHSRQLNRVAEALLWCTALPALAARVQPTAADLERGNQLSAADRRLADSPTSRLRAWFVVRGCARQRRPRAVADRRALVAELELAPHAGRRT